MRTARLLPRMALTLVVASAVAGTAWADPAFNPFQAPPPPEGISLPPMEFPDYSRLFARIVADRGLGRAFDASLVQRIQADSRIDRVRDRSPEPIVVVRVDLRDPDGTSRVRSENGDFPFYVLRETPKGLVLMGRMFGSVYRSYIMGQDLEFRVEQHLSGKKAVTLRFRVEDDVLVNLSAPNPEWRPSVANGIARR